MILKSWFGELLIVLYIPSSKEMFKNLGVIEISLIIFFVVKLRILTTFELTRIIWTLFLKNISKNPDFNLILDWILIWIIFY